MAQKEVVIIGGGISGLSAAWFYKREKPNARVLILENHDDASLHRLMTNLAGNDMQAVLDAFESVEGDTPTCFIAYTIKGHGTPLAGHRDNHAGLMTPAQIATLEDWVRRGAPDPRTANAATKEPSAADVARHWAFQPLAVGAPPKVAATDRVRNDVDRHLLAKLEAQGLTFSPAASKETLIRRAYLTLHGLPPSAEEIERFVPSIRLKLASAYRELGQWDGAISHLDWVLGDAKPEPRDQVLAVGLDYHPNSVTGEVQEEVRQIGLGVWMQVKFRLFDKKSSRC